MGDWLGQLLGCPACLCFLLASAPLSHSPSLFLSLLVFLCVPCFPLSFSPFLSLSLSLSLCVHCGVAGTNILKFIERGVKWHLKVKELVEKIRNATLNFAPHCNETTILCFGIPPHCNDLHIFKSECANHYSGVQIQN